MIIPVRCFTCGKVIGDKYIEFQEAVSAGKDPEQVLNDLGVTRYCCRRMIMSQADLLDDVVKFTR